MSDNLFILPCLCGNKPKITKECPLSRADTLYRVACTCGLISAPWSLAAEDATRLWNKAVMICFERESEAEDRWLARKTG